MFFKIVAGDIIISTISNNRDIEKLVPADFKGFVDFLSLHEHDFEYKGVKTYRVEVGKAISVLSDYPEHEKKLVKKILFLRLSMDQKVYWGYVNNIHAREMNGKEFDSVAFREVTPRNYPAFRVFLVEDFYELSGRV